MKQQSHELTALEGSWRAPSFEHARVADAMHAGVIACPPDASLHTVARMMAANHVHSVVVTAGGEAPIAMISERELLAAAGPGAEDSSAESLAVDPVTVATDDPLSRAVELMLEHRVSHLLVVSAGGHGLGVISALDVAGVLAWGQA
jgi:CBS domain-containing protein